MYLIMFLNYLSHFLFCFSTSLSISHDCSFVVSCGYDNIIKTWFLTPRCPDPPAAPKIISKSNHSVMISWKAPPSFNEPLTAFHLQHRIPGQKHWMPLNPINIPPTYRMKVVEDLSPATTYQFRLMAENRMGQSEWGTMSKQVRNRFNCVFLLNSPLSTKYLN